MDLRRPCRERIRRIDHRRQVAVVDGDALGGVLRGGLGLGDDQRHRFSDEAHPLQRKRVAMRHLDDGAVLALEVASSGAGS